MSKKCAYLSRSHFALPALSPKVESSSAAEDILKMEYTFSV